MSVYRLPLPADAEAETITQRMERLRAEAAQLAGAHAADFQRAVEAALALAQDIAEGGEAYQVGVREIARSLSLELRAASLGLEALRQRGTERASR